MPEDQDESEPRKKPSLAKLLKYGVDPNALSFEDAGERRTLLCLSIDEAVQTEDFSKVTLLLDARADPIRRSETGAFPLQLAAKHGRLQLARDLLQRKADVNQQDEKQVTSLHLAVHKDDARVVQLLLLHKANVNVADKVGQPPVFFCGSREVCASLLDAEADLMHLNKKGQSTLHLAAHSGAYETIAFLTENDQMRHMIDMQDERGRTALHHAAARGHQGIVARLMDVGADPRMKTNNGQTAMSLAGEKHLDCSYYIYTRVTGSNRSTWSEMAHNPIAMTLAAVLGVACWVNRKLLWEFSWDLAGLWLR
jgi:ankyrin repeat protein